MEARQQVATRIDAPECELLEKRQVLLQRRLHAAKLPGRASRVSQETGAASVSKECPFCRAERLRRCLRLRKEPQLVIRTSNMRAQLTAETAARAATVKTPASIVGTPKRDMLFVSHANPEDNAFTRWLALRLAREGYPVWCDLTKLLGGEDFWRDIETAIRQRAMKVLFVLSKASNQKAGTLKEIAVAEKVGKAFKDFIIPLRIDDLRSDDVTIELNRLNYVDFSRGWAAGYRKLLEKLEEDVVPKDGRFSPDTVTQWWRTNYPAAEGVLTKTDVHASNWFEFIQLPEVLWLHSIAPKELFEKAPLTLPVPAYHYEHYLLSFAAADEIRSALAEKGLEIANSVELDASQFQQEGMEHPKIERRDARNMVSAIFREGFERFALSRGLLSYELANKAQYYWFKKDLVENDKVFFRSPNGERNWRAMVGFKTLRAKEGSTRIRNWHFGIQAKTYFWPFTGLAVRP